MRLSTFLVLWIFFKNCVVAEIYETPLNGDNSVGLKWVLDYNQDVVHFELSVPQENTWFAFGFSDRGDAFPGDYCVLWTDFKGHEKFEDSYADPGGVLHRDEHQDCLGYREKIVGAVRKFTFHRKFDTCHNGQDDYIIQEGTTHLVWAKGTVLLYRLDGFNISSPVGDSGMVRVQLLKNTMMSHDKLPAHVKVIDVVTDKVTVPTSETTYWCHVHKLGRNFERKHHIYQFESHIEASSVGLVHHMEVFHCEAPPTQSIPTYRGDCFSKDRPPVTHACKRVLAAWAMGAPPFRYPQEAGLPLGGPDFNPYIMLEVHYNNPEGKRGVIDSSGIRLYVSDRLRGADAGVMELGLEYTDKMALPPGQEDFTLTGYCVSECTAVSLPPEGITVFGSQLHTHLTGIQVYTRHIRDGTELRELNRDNHFSTHFQEIRKLKIPTHVLPGDALITTCHYNTMARDNVTLGGFSITDEMCVNYIHYFPATKLEVCKSAIGDQALQTYFDYMRMWEGQEGIRPENGISRNYHEIKWTRSRAHLLDSVYREAPLSMQCNMSSGNRFPGYWENTPITSVLRPLPPPNRNC